MLLPSHVLIASRHPSPRHCPAHLHVLIQLPQSVEAAWQRLNIAQGTVVVAHVLTHEVLQTRSSVDPHKLNVLHTLRTQRQTQPHQPKPVTVCAVLTALHDCMHAYVAKLQKTSLAGMMAAAAAAAV
jgi:hypothetical protein